MPEVSTPVGMLGQIPAYLDALACGFRMRDLDKYLTPPGIAGAATDQTRRSGTFTGLTTEQIFKPQYQGSEKVPVFVRIFDRLIMGRCGTPLGPPFFGCGLSDSIGDGVTVAQDVQELANLYCHRTVEVELHIYDGQNHTQAGNPFFEQAQSFLTQRFEKLPFQNACAGIGPGNSIAPVPPPAS